MLKVQVALVDQKFLEMLESFSESSRPSKKIYKEAIISRKQIV